VLTKIRRIVEPNTPCGKARVKRLAGFGQIVLRLIVLFDGQTRRQTETGRVNWSTFLFNIASIQAVNQIPEFLA
jgi:hypothetical protein